LEPLKKKVLLQVISGLDEYVTKLRVDRNKQAQIKEKYGIKSLDKLVVDLDGELISLYERRDKGQNVDLAIRNKEEQKKKYERSKKELEDEIVKERNLTMNMPSFLGIIRVVPNKQVSDAMVRDEEIERLGMEVVMKYEKGAGRAPEDVSLENVGFDIRSKDNQGKVRCIEVKARAGIGAVALTQNEWFKAQRLRNDYYLYVVWKAAEGSTSIPIIIQNPAENLTVEQLEVVRYMISAAQIEQKVESNG
jgi:C4-type Zn-finger protein